MLYFYTLQEKITMQKDLLKHKGMLFTNGLSMVVGVFCTSMMSMTVLTLHTRQGTRGGQGISGGSAC